MMWVSVQSKPARQTDAKVNLEMDGAAMLRQFSRSQSRPTFKFVAPICASILCASEPGSFPWSNGFDYDSNSVQYTPDFTLHAPGFGFQEFLQPFEFGD